MQYSKSACSIGQNSKYNSISCFNSKQIRKKLDKPLNNNKSTIYINFNLLSKILQLNTFTFFNKNGLFLNLSSNTLIIHTFLNNGFSYCFINFFWFLKLSFNLNYFSDIF